MDRISTILFSAAMVAASLHCPAIAADTKAAPKQEYFFRDGKLIPDPRIAAKKKGGTDQSNCFVVPCPHPPLPVWAVCYRCPQLPTGDRTGM